MYLGSGMSLCFSQVDAIVNTVNRMAGVEYGSNKLQFDHVHNKMENVWAAFHPLAPRKEPCNLAR